MVVAEHVASNAEDVDSASFYDVVESNMHLWIMTMCFVV
jgi:hypothetical protein